MVTVVNVVPGSAADRAGVKKGDILLDIDGHNINDVLDYRFYMTEQRIKMLIHRGLELLTVTVDKDEYEDPGLEFETYLMDKKQRCKNACIFCFIDQMPKGCRESLYFKDDDDRLSFLQGNYITTTNLSDEEVDRVCRMHLSPINISVHTTEPELRVFMMKNKNAGKVMSIMRKFADAGITMNGQIVLCKNINDKEHLQKSMTDLETLFPAMQSVSIVPCGLTAHRENLYHIDPFTPEDCRAVIKQIESFSSKCYKKHGSRIFFAADEFYLRGGVKLHKASYYEGYPQYENGVGMVACMYDELPFEIKGIDEDLSGRKATLITGEAAYGVICDLADMVNKKTGADLKVKQIKNEFFGGGVTVSGLVVGRDIAAQLKDCDAGECIFIPSVMLRKDEDVFLDDMTVKELSEKLGVPVYAVPSDATAAGEIVKILGET
jgi:putative radical SAM enzyme (TIGR03279 family)